MIDTHCHLEKENYENIDEIIKKCQKENVNKIIVSGYDKNSNIEMINLAQKYEEIYATIGYHPEEADIVTINDIEILEKQIKNEKIVGIGEIGLDYHYNKTNKEKQKKLFKKQLELAQKYNLPVVIHSRDAINDTYEILKETNTTKGTMHCYSGSVEYAHKFIDLGLYLSIGGTSTFKNAKEIKKVIEDIPLNKLLLETDCPYLTPEPHRGTKNYPYYIPLIANNIAQLKNTTLEIVKSTTEGNTYALFDKMKKV